MRAKLQIESVENNSVVMVVVKDEDTAGKKTSAEGKKRFSDNPSGRLHFSVNNPDVAKELKVGDQYYADFTKAPNPSEAKSAETEKKA